MQAGLPSLHFDALAGRGKRTYVAAIHAAHGRDYAPMKDLFAKIITETVSAYRNAP